MHLISIDIRHDILNNTVVIPIQGGSMSSKNSTDPKNGTDTEFVRSRAIISPETGKVYVRNGKGGMPDRETFANRTVIRVSKARARAAFKRAEAKKSA